MVVGSQARKKTTGSWNFAKNSARALDWPHWIWPSEISTLKIILLSVHLHWRLKKSFYQNAVAVKVLIVR